MGLPGTQDLAFGFGFGVYLNFWCRVLGSVEVLWMGVLG